MTPQVGVFVTSSSGNTSPGSVLWLDANDSSITDSVWPDKSGRGNDAVKNGSVGISSHQLNGLKVMEYNGTNGSYHEFPEIADARTVFWVVRSEKGLSLIHI